MTKKPKISAFIVPFAALLTLTAWAAFLRPLSNSLAWHLTQRDELKTELNSEISQIAALSNSVREKVGSANADREKILGEIADASRDFSLSIDKLSVGEVTSNGDLRTVTVQIEVSGYLNGIAGFLQRLCPETRANVVDGISILRAGELPWFARKADGERPLDWWNLARNEAETEPSCTELSSLIGSGKMRCFAEITFVGGA